MAETIHINYPGKMLPYQREFHASTRKNRGVIGGVGSGKTTTLCMEILIQLLKYPNNLGVLLRLEKSRLISSTLPVLYELLPEKLILSQDKNNGIINLINGSTLIYTGLDESKGGFKKIESANLGLIAVDQAEEINGASLLHVRKTRLRRPASGRVFIWVANDAGANWIVEEFIKGDDVRKVSDTHYISPQSETWVVSTEVNKENLPKDYYNELFSMPDWWKQRYIYASLSDWSAKVFNLKPEMFTVPLEKKDLAQYDMFIVGIDYGRTNPSAAVYTAWSSKDHVGIVFDEIYKAGTLISEFATMIRERNEMWGIQPLYVIDPHTKQSTGIRDGLNVYNDFVHNYIPAIPGTTDRMGSMLRVQELLDKGRLRISLMATNLKQEMEKLSFRELGPARREKENPPEGAEKKADHAIDALRYAAQFAIDSFGGIPHQQGPKMVEPKKQLIDYIFSDLDKFQRTMRRRKVNLDLWRLV